MVISGLNLGIVTYF